MFFFVLLVSSPLVYPFHLRPQPVLKEWGVHMVETVKRQRGISFVAQ